MTIHNEEWEEWAVFLKFDSVEEMLRTDYSIFGDMEVYADYLGISSYTLREKMNEIGIPRDTKTNKAATQRKEDSKRKIINVMDENGFVEMTKQHIMGRFRITDAMFHVYRNELGFTHLGRIAISP